MKCIYILSDWNICNVIDLPDVGVATVFAVLENGRKEFIGEVRAYNWEAIWLSTVDFDVADDAEDWWKCVNDTYERLGKALG